MEEIVAVRQAGWGCYSSATLILIFNLNPIHQADSSALRNLNSFFQSVDMEPSAGTCDMGESSDRFT